MNNINITSGEMLNNILIGKYTKEVFIPFNEAMITGTYKSKLFSEEFIIERSNTHNVTTIEYKEKLKGYLDFLNDVNKYDKVTLWFGDEDFCVANTKVVLEALKLYEYKGVIVFNIVNEINGDILNSKVIGD